MRSSSPSRRVPDRGLAGRAVVVDRGDGGVVGVVEEGADRVGEGHAPDGTRAGRRTGPRASASRRIAAAAVRRWGVPAGSPARGPRRGRAGWRGPTRFSIPSARSVAPIRRPNETNASTSACLASSWAIAVDDVAVDLDDADGRSAAIEREAGVAGARRRRRRTRSGAAQGLDLALAAARRRHGLLLGALEGDLRRASCRPRGPARPAASAWKCGSSMLAGVMLIATRSGPWPAPPDGRPAVAGPLQHGPAR